MYSPIIISANLTYMKEDFYLAGEDVGMNIIPVMNIDAGYKLQDEQLPNVLPLFP